LQISAGTDVVVLMATAVTTVRQTLMSVCHLPVQPTIRVSTTSGATSASVTRSGHVM